MTHMSGLAAERSRVALGVGKGFSEEVGAILPGKQEHGTCLLEEMGGKDFGITHNLLQHHAQLASQSKNNTFWQRNSQGQTAFQEPGKACGRAQMKLTIRPVICIAHPPHPSSPSSPSLPSLTAAPFQHLSVLALHRVFSMSLLFHVLISQRTKSGLVCRVPELQALERGAWL